MKNKLFFCFHIFCAATLVGCSRSEIRTVKIADEVYKEVSQRGFGTRKAGFLPGNLQGEYFSEKRLKKYSLKTLNLLYNVSESLTFYFPENQNYIEWEQNTFNEKARRNDFTDHNISDMHWAYINTRMFDRAAEIRERFPAANYPAVPEVIAIDTETATARWPVYDVFEEGKKIELKELHLEAGPKVIVSISAGCPIAERAMKAILADPELAPVFKKNGVLLTVKFDVMGVLRWREQFNFRNIYIAYKASRLPEFNFTISPYFYFMRNGKVLSSIDGWGEKWRQEILNGFEAISISTSSW
ncbi:MAG: hypothetical protein WCK75_00385 [Elusimicrobiota bacterium]